MRLVLEADESWSIMTLVVSQVLDGVELSEAGRAGLRKWRSDHANGTAAMQELAEEMNASLGTLLDEQTRKLIRRKGRFVSSADKR